MSLESMAPLIEKIERLSKLQRILIYIATFVILIGAFVYFSYMPKLEEINKLNAKLEGLQKDLAVAKKNAQQLNAYREKMEQAEEQFRIVMRALPDKDEIPSLLASISKSGQDAGLDFLLFKPMPEAVKDFYAELPVSIEVLGKYHNVAVFFDKVAQMSRIVNVQNVSMLPSKTGDTLTTACTAVTYKFVEVDETKAAQKKTDGKKSPAKQRKTRKK